VASANLIGVQLLVNATSRGTAERQPLLILFLIGLFAHKADRGVSNSSAENRSSRSLPERTGPTGTRGNPEAVENRPRRSSSASSRHRPLKLRRRCATTSAKTRLRPVCLQPFPLLPWRRPKSGLCHQVGHRGAAPTPRSHSIHRRSSRRRHRVHDLRNRRYISRLGVCSGTTGTSAIHLMNGLTTPPSAAEASRIGTTIHDLGRTRFVRGRHGGSSWKTYHSTTWRWPVQPTLIVLNQASIRTEGVAGRASCDSQGHPEDDGRRGQAVQWEPWREEL
jgi:hypothetical protein